MSLPHASSGPAHKVSRRTDLTTPQAPAFFLTNNASKPPIIHDVFVPSTNTWQYIVACPSTLHCLILDPVRDRCADPTTISTNAAEELVAVVRKQSYVCDLILETNATRSTLSAAWHLRMQLNDIQGFPPQVCRDATAVTPLENMWQRKYGKQSPFTSTLRDSPADNERILVGRMPVICMSVPTFGAPNHRAYLIGDALFGAHGIAALSTDDWSITGSTDTTSTGGVQEEACDHVWTAMQRVLSLPENTRVYHDREPVVAADKVPFDLVGHCRASNPYVGLSNSEFLVRRQGEYQSWQQQQPKSSGRRHKHSRSKGGSSSA